MMSAINFLCLICYRKEQKTKVAFKGIKKLGLKNCWMYALKYPKQRENSADSSCLLQLPDKYSCLAKSDFLLNAAFCLVRLPVKSRFVCFVVVVSFLPFVVVNVVVVVVVVVAAAAAECSFVLTAVPVA